MESLDIVKFGIFDDFSHVFGTGIITNVISLNHREMIISTTKEIIKIEKSVIKMRHPIKFSTCAIVPGTDFLIGITTKKGDLIIYQIGDLPQKQQSYNSRSIELPPPLLENYSTNQSGIFHMIYSPKSQSIITIGAGIKVFSLKYKLSRISVIKPTVSISPRSSFASDYATTILVPPAFDSDTELLLLPTDEGICAYNLDGHLIMQCSKYPASVSTVYATHPSKPPKLADVPNDKSTNIIRMSKKLLTYDSNKGMALWGKRGQLIDQFETIGSSVLAIMFVDSENALCLNSSHALFFLNIKTGKTFFCLNLEKNPSRLFLTFVNNEPFLCACFASYMRVLKIVIPWRVWNLNINKTLNMRRCNKFRSAARVLVSAENSFIKFYSPRDGGKMTVATPAEACRPVSFLYDRGIVENFIFNEKELKFSVSVSRITNKTAEIKENSKEEEEDASDKTPSRDILFIILENGTILGFDTNVANCEEVMKMKCKAAFMSICRIRATNKKKRASKNEENQENEEDSYQWCYAVASPKSDLFILDYFSMKEVRHFTVSDDTLIKMFFHFESECIIMVFARKTILFDIEKGIIIDTVLVGGNQTTTLFSNYLIIGYETGHIRHISIENKRFVLSDSSNKKKKKKEENNEEEEEEVKEKVENTHHHVVADKSNNALQKPHSGPITGFSFSLKIWISSGLDGNVIVWDYNFEKVYKICLPLPLRSCLIMNGKRDILVATETEVMLIKNNYLAEFFEEDPIDVEFEDIDNFDKIKDALCHDSIESFDPDAYEDKNVSDGSYEEEEEEIENKNDKQKVNISNTPKNIAKKLIDSKPAKTENEEVHHETAPKNSKPADDSPENVQKKLEMMQAMNGIGPTSSGPPKVSTPTPKASSTSTSNSTSSPAKSSTENEKPKETEKPKVVETKKKKPQKDGKALNDFISNNMEQEKAQSKRKKVKKNNNQEAEQPKDDTPKKSESEVADMIGNLFDRNKPKDKTNQNTKKKSGDGIDFNELAKKFNKDEDPLVVNLDKADLSKKGKTKNKDEDNQDENDDDDDDENTQKSKPKETTSTKPKSNSNSTPKASTNAAPKTSAKDNNSTPKTSTKPKNTEKEKESTKPAANTKSSSKPKEKEKTKDKDNDNKAKEKKPQKGSTSQKPQKEPPKATSQPQQATSNETKNNNSPKKAKNPSPPKSSTKPASNTNSTTKPTTNSNANSIPSSTTTTNPSNNNSNNNNNNNNTTPVSSSNANSNPNSNSQPTSSVINIPSTNTNANLTPKSSSNDKPSAVTSNNTNNDGGGGGNSKSVYDNDDDRKEKPNRISIGTQGENFGDDEEGEKAEDKKQDDAEEPVNIEIKMNGPRPDVSTNDDTGNTEEAQENEDENNDNAADQNDEQQEEVAHQQQEEQPISEAQNEGGTKAYNDSTEKASIENSDKLHNSDNEASSIAEADNDNPKSGSDTDTIRQQRAPTPPPIRPKLETPKPDRGGTGRQKQERKRPRTPPPKREKTTSEFRMPPPNVIIDQEAVLVLYGRGRLEFKPLVDRIQRDMLMVTNYGNGFYRQNKHITLSYIQNFSDNLQQKPPDDSEKKLSKSQPQVVPPITPPHASSARGSSRPFETPFMVPNGNYDRNDRDIFNGSVNSISPAFKNRQKGGFSNSMRPNSSREVGLNENGLSAFSVTVENGNDSKSPRQPLLPRISDMHNTFSPAAYVYNYKNNTETIFNSLDTSSSVTTPRSRLKDGDNESSEEEIVENNNLEGEVTNDDSKSFKRSPRRIQSARATGRPLIDTNSHDFKVNMPFPLSPVVMASPRRSIINKQRPLIQDNRKSSEEEIPIPVDQLESAVMTKMPRLHFVSSTPQQPQFQHQQQFIQSPSNISPNFGASPNNQNYPRRPNSVRTFDRSPLMFNQPIGIAMVKPGKAMKRNAAFYASVAVTTSISNARKSSPSYHTGNRPKKPMKLSNRNNLNNGQIDDMNALARSSSNDIEITVK